MLNSTNKLRREVVHMMTLTDKLIAVLYVAPFLIAYLAYMWVQEE